MTAWRRPAAIVAAATAAVFCAGWVPSLWTDEAATISAATRPVGDLWRMLHTLDAVHGAYYLLMHAWVGAAGIGEVALRAPSALAVGVGAWGVYRLAAELRRPDLATLATVCYVALPRVAWSGIEARSFALATTLGIWATVVLLRALDRGGRARWVGYVALATLAVVVNIYLALLVVAHGVAVLLVARAATLRWLVSAALAGVLSAPVALVAMGQTGQLGQVDPTAVFLVRSVAVNQWFLGETPTVYVRGVVATGVDPGSVWQVSAVLLAVVALVLVGLAVVRRRADRSWLLAWTLPWALLPSVALMAWAVVSRTYSPRYATFTSPAIAVLLAAGLATVPRTAWRRGLAVLLVVLAAPVWVSQRTENAKSGADWRQVAAVVAAHSGPGDGVYFAPRTPPTGDEVTVTTRGVAVAYPGAFAGLEDLTLRVTPTRAADLTGRSVPLARVADRLAGLNRVVVVRRLDYPAGAAAADDALIERAGLVRQKDWSGSLDEVVVFAR